jgi:tRNA-splicing endonuclease subunit Sen15
MLKSEMESRKSRNVEDAEGGDGKLDPKPEREWVLPTHLKEEWSLRRFAEIFNSIGLVPPEEDHTQPERLNQDNEINRWRTTKRVLLATLQDDSTVVYYIVHDGIVKPRQN